MNDDNGSPVQMLWVERYRPRKVEDMALATEHRELLKTFLAQGEIPHLLFTGPPGSGKTTAAKILINALDCEVLALNASKERGIDVVRDRVGTFAKVLGVAKWKLVFLDEADGLTSDAQNSLRNLLEDFAEQTRFILTANYLHKIISPLQSRCTHLELGETPLKERILILSTILQAEGIAVDLPVVLSYAEKYHDLRRMIVAAQRSVMANNGVLSLATAKQFQGVELLRKVVAGNWDALVAVAQDATFDPRQGLVAMFWAVADVTETKRPATVRFKLAKAVHESGFTPDPVVHFLGTCAELIAEGE